jgi:aminoglycoside phosphotransferase (APT) family kinase protein/SAM-dependent methyltransferase
VSGPGGIQLTSAERELLERLTRELGWTVGLERFISELPDARGNLFARRLVFDFAGWRFLLGAGRFRRVLCLTGLFENTPQVFAALADEVIAATFDPMLADGVSQRLADSAYASARCVVLNAAQPILPYPDAHFDLVVSADLPAAARPFEASSPLSADGLASLARELRRVVEPGGEVYLGVPAAGSGGMFPWLRPRRSDAHRIDKHVVGRALKIAGFERRMVHPILYHHGLATEVIRGRYRSLRTGQARKERIKEILLRGPLAAVLTPGGAVIGRGARDTGSLLDEIVRVVQQSVVADDARPWRVKRYLVLPGKVILSIGPGAGRNGRVITVLPLSQWNVDRRRHESRMLDRLAASGTAMAALAPRTVAEGSILGQAFFVQSESSGVSVDTAHPQLEQLTNQAAATLAEFHAATARDVLLAGETLTALLSHPLAVMESQLTTLATTAGRRIGDTLRRLLVGSTVRAVWSHGDYKIENALFDPGTLVISGVIDWDLSQEQGWPLLDLLQLIAYNRVLRERRSFEDVVRTVLLPWSLSPDEQQLVSDYVRRVGLPSIDPTIQVALFWVHHLGYRFRVGQLHEQNARVRDVTIAIANRLEKGS